MAADQAEIVAFLARPAAHGVAGPVERVDTHISHVFLAGDRALKLKRAVKLPYLDFSTPEKRRAACEAELAVNRRTAPELYLAVTPVVRRADGALAVGGEGAPLDWLVVMRRFDQANLYDKMAERGALGADQVAAAVEMIARFHDAAELVAGGAGIIRRIMEGNVESVARSAVPRPLAPARADALHAACRARFRALEPLLDRRGAEGRIRDGHGDLHLRNICLVGGKPLLFDAIEFDPAFRRIDVFYDFAFLLMDLLHRRLAPHANSALAAYVGATGDIEGVATLPLFLAVRAIIRGHITAMMAAADGGGEALWAEAGAYFDLAEAALAPPPPVLLAIGGLSGTGKSTLGRAIAPRLGAMPGALMLRSDVVRKRLAGVPAEQRLPESCYTPEWSERVYAELLRLAGVALGGGHSVIVDAVSGHAEQRAALEAAAQRAGALFLGIWLEAPRAVREARIGGRIGGRIADASDADLEVARRQQEPDPASLAWRRLDAAGELPRTLETLAAALAAAGVRLRRD
ncbi:MAG TPA: AAA family ATPase [Alphaproteobacteria bacterium]